MPLKLPGPIDVPLAPSPRGSGAVPQVPEVSTGLGELGSGLFKLGQALTDAEQRVKDKADTIDRVRQQNDFSAAATGELQRLATEDDFTQPATLDKFAQFLDDRIASTLGRHQGGDQSRTQLATQLEGRRAQLAAQAAQLAYDEQNKMVANHIGAQLNSIELDAYQKPGKIADLFRSVDALVDDMRPALRPGQENIYRRQGRERVAEGGLNALIMRGQVDAADRLLAGPELASVLGAEARARVHGRIAAMRQAHAEADARGDASRATLRAALGREPTAAEMQAELDSTSTDRGGAP